ncbi:MAG: hypothetical protein R3236_01825 [Phycisphaeraceae bacterium]|nr:hypothetical protein [Phycisphaeraceae bacterium]
MSFEAVPTVVAMKPVSRSIAMGWLVGLTLSGCGWMSTQSDSGTRPAAVTALGPGDRDRLPPWPYRPRSLRLDPLSSLGFDRQNKQWVLEARLNLLDHEGDRTKGLGRVRFELLADSTRGSKKDTDALVQSWSASLKTAEAAVEYYDPITHGYVFELTLDDPPPNRPLKLRADWTVRRKSFSDTVEIRVRPSAP